MAHRVLLTVKTRLRILYKALGDVPAAPERGRGPAAPGIGAGLQVARLALGLAAPLVLVLEHVVLGVHRRHVGPGGPGTGITDL